MSKWRIVEHDKHPMLNITEVRGLAMVVAMNYERRSRGERPDVMHWADLKLLEEGFHLEPADQRELGHHLAGLLTLPSSSRR
jgi:hypothetical protein